MSFLRLLARNRLALAGLIVMGIVVLLALLTAYAGWRTTQRRALTPDEQGSFAVITPNATPLAVDAVLEEAQSDDPSPQPAT